MYNNTFSVLDINRWVLFQITASVLDILWAGSVPDFRYCLEVNRLFFLQITVSVIKLNGLVVEAIVPVARDDSPDLDI